MPSEFETLLLRMDAGFERVSKGFDKVYGKIDDIKEDFKDHIPVCQERFGKLESDEKVRKAVNGERKNQEAEKKDWGKWYVRLVLGAITLSLIALLWERFVLR